MNKITPIGVIAYKQYEERVLIDDTFNVEDLPAILKDPDFVSFDVIKNGTVTHSTADKPGTEKLEFITTEKNVEILSTVYNVFAKNPYKHKTKTTWQMSTGGYYEKKADALDAVRIRNKRIINKIRM